MSMDRKERKASSMHSFRNYVFMLQGGLSGQGIELGLPLMAAGAWFYLHACMRLPRHLVTAGEWDVSIP